ncbi:hypothetical protein PABG_11383 [Paracoccidioides brasiliensis Pb03]|nr:hypothetical protein PABG_11383 [Paracoccidioides brasiliensis Pb03]
MRICFNLESRTFNDAGKAFLAIEELVSTSPCSRFMPRSSSDLLPRGGEAANSERQPNIRRKRWARFNTCIPCIVLVKTSIN